MEKLGSGGIGGIQRLGLPHRLCYIAPMPHSVFYFHFWFSVLGGREAHL